MTTRLAPVRIEWFATQGHLSKENFFFRTEVAPSAIG